MKGIFNYQLADNTVVFTDSLKKDSSYVAKKPRDHESIFFVTKGALLYEKGDIREVIETGQVGYIARGSSDKSSAYLCDEVSYIAVNFSFDKGDHLSAKTLPFKILCSQGFIYKYEQLFKDALNHYILKTPGYIAICNGLIMQIIGYLYNEHNIDVVKYAKMQQIEAGIQYLNRHYNSPELKISELADKVYMSEKHFRRVFFEVYNQTPYAYLQKLRISKAEILLLNMSKKISEIALQCGFCDIYSFSHCFKKHTGISPTEYRSSHI
ncbi:MAG: helix-turn-helix transcriptional regulator [Clostridia bacterium]|nr:helix-turn-helix transcriptional regulator [Clostridia bacterium]